MPGGDGTGPLGRGSMTGRGMGPCGKGSEFRRGFGRRCSWMDSQSLTLKKEDQIEILKAEEKQLELELKRLQEKLKELE